MPILTVHVKSITMAAPNIICVQVSDQEKEPDITVDMGSPQGTLTQDVTVTHPITGLPKQGRVGGRNLQWIWFYDTKPTAFLDRATVDNPANWPVIGGRTVVSVHRITKPAGREVNYGPAKFHSLMSHQLFLVLDGDLPQGSYTVSCAGNPFPATAFTFDDYATRAMSIHSTQVGHRPADKWKVGTLSMWVPGYGTEGAVTFSATTFQIIDNGGNARFTGNVTLVKDRTQTESSEQVYYYPSTTTPPKTITAISKANPGVVTIAGHGYSNGQRKHFRGIGGMTQLEGVTAVITVVDANNFSIGIDTTAYGTFNAAVFATGYNGLCYDTFTSNSGCTNIYELDYSAFNPGNTGELYRIRVPGLGVSYPFRIDAAVNRKMADVHFKGIYNQQYGMPLSASVGGWNRPQLFKDTGGSDVMPFYETLMTSTMDNEAGYGCPGRISGAQGALAPWGPGTRLTGFYMPWSDAGDMDFHLIRHAQVVWSLLEIGYIQLPSPARNLSWGFPKSALLDASFYAGTDSLPDVFHIAIRTLDIFRQTQKVDGSVYSGIRCDGAGSGSSGGSYYEPGHVNSFTGYALAPDHAANFCYAQGAATIGRALKDAGFTTAGDAWIASAVSAWNWANTIYLGYAASGIAHADVIAHYITELNLKVNAGFDDAALTAHLAVVQTLAGARREQAGCALLRATNDIAYGNLFDGFPGAFVELSNAISSWDYAHTPSAQSYMVSKGVGGYYDSRWASRADSTYAASMSGDGYKHPRGAGVGYMSPGLPVSLMQAAIKTVAGSGEDSNYIKWLRAATCFFTGANQGNFVPTIGLGFENFANPLHRDTQAMRDPPPIGITSYTWDYAPIITIRAFNWALGDSAVNFTTNCPSAVPNADGLHNEKVVTPYWASLPHQLAHWDNSYFIYSTEFVTQDQIFTLFVLNVFLHCWDTNTATDYTVPTVLPFRARAA